MSTVFSYIIQKRFSQVNEDVATDALAYVLETSDAARRGMTKFLRGIMPELPPLQFKTQLTEGSIRPDMWGFAEANPRVFFENKFWAGLTDNQPVSYLKKLAGYSEATALIVISPSAREHTLWRELTRRLDDAGIAMSESEPPAGVAYLAGTELGPTLAITSWTNVLSMLENEAVEEPGARADIVQLRALCDAADIDAFTPVSIEELSDQRSPAFVLQIGSIIQTAVDQSLAENILSVNGLRPQSSWDRIGRYVWMPGHQGAGAWFGLHFGLWKSHGATPLWLLFTPTGFGRAQEVARLIEPWALKNGVLTTTYGSDFAVALDFPAGEEKAGVIRSLVTDIRAVGSVLNDLPPRKSESL